MKLECAVKLKEQLRAEIQAYNAYDMLKSMTEDTFLEEALEEIMYDEFLHAKFLRSYLIDANMYDMKQHSDLEAMYTKMLED